MRGGASLPVQRNCSEVTFGTLFGNNGGGSVRRKIVERGGGAIECTVIYNTGAICSLLEVVVLKVV